MRNKLFMLIPSLLLLTTSCEYEKVRHDISEYILETNYEEDFVILQLTDIHFGDKDNQQLHMDFMDLTIKDSNCDMIVVTGDLFTFTSKETAITLFDFLDSYNVPWTVTFGNHDEQCYFSVDWLTDYLNNYGSNCLFKDIQDDDVTGNSNFAINLMDNGKVFEQIILFDSNRYNYGQYVGYDYIKQNQIDWYERLVNYTTSINEKTTVDSLCFMHIPVPEYEIAYNMYLNGELSIDGEKNEKTTCPKYNSGLFSKMVELGSTKAIFCGHDHLNNFKINYEGIDLCYGINSTNRVYFDNDMMGGQTITLHKDHSYDIKQIYHTYEEVK